MPIVLPPSLDPLTDYHGAALARHLPIRNGDRVTLPDGLTYVIVVFTNRSGSSFLCELLGSTGYFNVGQEVLNQDLVISTCAQTGWASFSSYFAATAAENARNGHFVFKSSVGQLAVMAHHGLLARIMPSARFLVTERTDKLAQAISWSIAVQTDHYTSGGPKPDRPPPVYDFAALRSHVAHFLEVHATIGLFMTLNGLTPLHIQYESLAAAPLLVGRLACAHLGRPDLVCDLARVPLERQATERNAAWRARFLAEPAAALVPPPAAAPRPAPPDTMVYRSVSLWNISHDKAALADGRPLVERRPFLAASSLDVPAVAFGDTDFGRAGITLIPPDDPGAVRLERPPQPAYLVRNALVHGKYGVLTLGERAVEQTLPHLPTHLIPGAAREAGGDVRLPVLPVSATVHSAYHLLACNIDNYYHWLIDAISRFRPVEYAGFADDPETPSAPNLLIPTLDRFWKWESLALLVPRSLPQLPLTGEGRVFVQRLLFVPDLSGGAFRPHPELLAAFDAMRAAVLGATPARPSRRLYVSRADSGNRVLVNEAEVMARVERAGFTPVLLSKKPVAEQIRLFAEASHIIAPHGAGLTNIGFCQPGAALCELHMDSYVHWAFRRLAAMRGVRYGCILGTTLSRHPTWLHGSTWKIDLDALDGVLADPAFLGG